MAESLPAHYGPRVRAPEHRYLVVFLVLPRPPGCEIVFLCSQEPDAEVLEYYDALTMAKTGATCLDRFHTIVLDDGTPRSVSAKLLDRPDVLERIRARTRGRLTFVQPWNVTELE